MTRVNECIDIYDYSLFIFFFVAFVSSESLIRCDLKNHRLCPNHAKVQSCTSRRCGRPDRCTTSQQNHIRIKLSLPAQRSSLDEFVFEGKCVINSTSNTSLSCGIPLQHSANRNRAKSNKIFYSGKTLFQTTMCLAKILLKPSRRKHEGACLVSHTNMYRLACSILSIADKKGPA